MSNWNGGNRSYGCNVTALKYGDADVSSKRRKLSTVQEQTYKEDLENAKQNKQINEPNNDGGYNHFKNNIYDETMLNSSLCDNSTVKDFKGGLLSFNHMQLLSPITTSTSRKLSFDTGSNTSSSSINNLTISNINHDVTISKKPSSSSKGFENTFKLLQSHVENNFLKRQHTFERLTLSPSPSFSSMSSCSSLSSNSTLLNVLNNDNEQEAPTLLELECEALQRIRNVIISMDKNTQSFSCDHIVSTPMLEFFHDFVSKGLPKTNESPNEISENHDGLQYDKRKDIGDSFLQPNDDDDDAKNNDQHNESLNSLTSKQTFIYHASKTIDGKNCLRIIRNLLREKVLCGNRVSQMTRTYDDIEAVTRLLEEKEKDLELTVQIGKELLTQNNALENRISELESDLKSTNEDRAQLLHELHKKNELIAVLTNDSDDATEGADTLSKSITHDLLQKKIASLEDENKSLKMEASQLAYQTDEVEAHERQLVEDITSQLNDANKQFENLNLELERQREENRLQHEQIVSLTARLAETEMRLHQLTHDNEEHMTLLNITKENQNSLALELVEFKQRYQEVLALLQEAQEQLRKQRKKQMPQARSSFVSNIIQPDSLQCELMESSMFSENSLDSGISGDSQRMNDRISRMMSQVPGMMYSSGLGGSMMSSGISTGPMPSYKKVFETVRCASKNGNYADTGSVSLSQIGSMSMSSSTGPRMSAYAGYSSSVHPAGSYYHDSVSSMGKRSLSTESLTLQSDDEDYPTQPAGVPGAPGAKELEAALKRLTPGEVLARRAMLSHAPAGTYSYDEQERPKEMPLGIRTPDSIMSTGSSGVSSTFMNLSSSNQWRLPEKLQIIKPMEGSQTLHHWSRLATPTLSGLLDERPGVTIRGGRNLEDLGMHVYTLSDVEEDVPEDLPPGKQYMTQGCTYTYTTSTVMHPDDGLLPDSSFLSQSQMSSRMASTSTSRQPSCPPTPRTGLSRKNSCSTFSVNLGLASMLNERGIKAITPSALNTPAGPNFTPTVTPCNSPEGSPTRNISPEPMFGFLASGADLIRRKLVGGDIERPNRNQPSSKQQQQQKILLSRLEKRALRSLKLVEKVESIGLENIISTQPNASGSGIVNRSSSPMSHISNLRSLNTSSNSIVDDLYFDREQIKDVLHKGLKSQQSQKKQQNLYNDDMSSNESSYNSDNEEYISINIGSSSKKTSDINQKGSNNKIPSAASSSGAIKINYSGAGICGSSVSIPSASETRLRQMQRQKSRRNLKNGMAGQRPDLGTIGSSSGAGRMRTDLGKVDVPKQGKGSLSNGANKNSNNNDSCTDNSKQNNKDNNKSASSGANARAEQSITQSFVGTVSSLLFGRKGGWL